MSEVTKEISAGENAGFLRTGAEPERQDVSIAREQASAVAAIQASYTVAKRFPRDETMAFNRIMEACKRPSLAEQAVYAYPRGGQTVSGPSIRLAEVLARAWGNLSAGVIELAQGHGESTMRAQVIDLETNFIEYRDFKVQHKRFTKKGTYDLDDPRDIYELTANNGSRRLRACILAVVPGDIVEAAVRECENTLAKGGGEPLIDRVRKMVVMFGELGVDQAAIEKRLGHPVAATIEAEFVTLRGVYKAIKDGFSGREAFFEVAGASKASDELPAGGPAPINVDKTTGEVISGGGGWMAAAITNAEDPVASFEREQATKDVQATFQGAREMGIAHGSDRKRK